VVEHEPELLLVHKSVCVQALVTCDTQKKEGRDREKRSLTLGVRNGAENDESRRCNHPQGFFLPSYIPCVLLHGPNAGLGIPSFFSTDFVRNYRRKRKAGEVRDRKENSSWQSWYPQPATTQSELTSIDTQVEEHLAVLARNLLCGIAKETFMSRPVVEDSDWENKKRIDLEPLVEQVDGMCHFVHGDDAGNRG